MDGYVIGLAVGIGAGIAIGISIGISFGKKQKSWSELNESERKLRIGIIAGLSVLAVAGLVVFLFRLWS